jgi:pimeloyl-ACP methyl ester carboxylesterase
MRRILARGELADRRENLGGCMKISVNGNEVYCATDGKEPDPALPLMVFLHGAGFDHTVWLLLVRRFAHSGLSLLAPDLPGRGRSAGPPLRSIAEMADSASCASSGSRRRFPRSST